MTEANLPDLITKREAAAYLRCDPSTLDRWRRERPDFPKPIKLGRRVLFRRADIVRLVQDEGR